MRLATTEQLINYPFEFPLTTTSSCCTKLVQLGSTRTTVVLQTLRALSTYVVFCAQCTSEINTFGLSALGRDGYFNT